MTRSLGYTVIPNDWSNLEYIINDLASHIVDEGDTLLPVYLLANGSRELSANWDAGAFQITALNFVSDVTTGTSPFACTSTTLNTNLNADLLDGQHGAYYATAAGYVPYTGAIGNVDLGAYDLTVTDINLTGKLIAGSQASPVDVTATREYGLEIHYSGNNYNVTGIRSKAQLVTTDTAYSATGGLFQAANNDGINAGVLNGLLAEAIGKSDTTAATISMMRAGIFNAEWNAKDTITDLRTLHVRTHTRNNATEGYISNSGYGVYIENEAVGGNGQALDAGIYLKGTNISGGNSAFTHGIDFSGATYATADIKLSDDSVINDSNGRWGVQVSSPEQPLHIGADRSDTPGTGSVGFSRVGGGGLDWVIRISEDRNDDFTIDKAYSSAWSEVLRIDRITGDFYFESGTIRVFHNFPSDYSNYVVDNDGNLEITATGGNISFDNENIVTTGTLGAGAITGTGLTNNGGTQLNDTLTIGGSGAGHNVTFWGDSGALGWKSATNTLQIVSGALELSSTTLTQGENGAGYNTILYGDTSGKKFWWDASEDLLKIDGSFQVVGTSQFDNDIILGDGSSQPTITFRDGDDGVLTYVDTTNTLYFGDTSISTTGGLTAVQLAIGTLTITDGVIDDTDGTIDFGNTAFTGVDAIGCGAVTSTGIGTFTEVNIGQVGSHAETKLAIGTTATLSIANPAYVEMFTTPSYPASVNLKAGINVEISHLTSALPAYSSAGLLHQASSGDFKDAIASRPFYGLYGAATTDFTQTQATGAGKSASIYGMSYSSTNTNDWTPTTSVGLSIITTVGAHAFSNLGYTAKTISGGRAQGISYGGYFLSNMLGTYNGTAGSLGAAYKGKNYGLYVTTTNSIADATGDIDSYGLYIDACAGSEESGGGEVISWGLYEANGRNNVLYGNTRIGSTVAPVNALDVTGAATIGDGGTTNCTAISAIGNISFVGTAGFYPRRITQSAIPAAGTGATQIDTGEMLLWRDSDDGNVYFVYNDTDSGIKSIELT